MCSPWVHDLSKVLAAGERSKGFCKTALLSWLRGLTSYMGLLEKRKGGLTG